MPESPIFGNDLIQIGFNFFGADGTGTSYDGQVLNPPYDYEGENNTTVTATGSMTCENIYCHGTLADGTNWGDGANTAPAWDGTLACGDCHLATNDNPPLLGSHEVHAGSNGLDLSCETCHAGYPDGHVNNQADFSFSSDPLLTGAAYDGTPDMFDDYGQCSNLYCHSNVQDDTGTGGPTDYATPTWGEQLTCSDCHGDPPDSGNHTIHIESTHHGITAPIVCDTCHADSNHADDSIDVDASQAYTHDGDPGNGFGMCASACHTGAIWNASSITCFDCHQSNCNDCHGSSPSPPPQETPTVIPEDDIEAATAAEVTLAWNAVPPSAGWQTEYQVELRIYPESTNPEQTLAWSPGTQRNVTLYTSHIWYWRVQARDMARPGITSEWSVTDDFAIRIPDTPLIPLLIDEPNITPTELPDITLAWHPVTSPPPSIEYLVEVDLDSTNFNPPFYSSGWITATGWTFTPEYYAPYWWRVKARNIDDPSKESAWSRVDRFWVNDPDWNW
jgi:predicted CxxxxCH...CXXCH cytochrome family protein